MDISQSCQVGWMSQACVELELESTGTEDLLHAVAYLQFETWSSTTQRCVMLVNKQTYLQYRHRITHVSTRHLVGVSCLTALQDLTIWQYGWSPVPPVLWLQVDALSRLVHLSSLELQGSCRRNGAHLDVSLLKGLTVLTALQRLRLSNIALLNIHRLPSLPQLVSLDLGNNGLRGYKHYMHMDHSPWAVALPNLQVLNLSGVLHGVPQLQAHKALASLDLSHNLGIQDFSPLAALTSLTALNLSRTGMESLDQLSSLHSLKSLCARSCRLVARISPLPHGLELLDLSFTPVQDITPLRHLTRLEVLCLRHTMAKDLHAIRGMSHLSELDVSNTCVADVRPLTALSTLRNLHIAHAMYPAEHNALLFAMTNLRFLDVRDSKHI